MSTRTADLALAPPPDPPELPPGARPGWSPWFGFAAMAAGTALVVAVSFPLVPVALSSVSEGPLGAIALLVLILVQDAAYVGSAVGFAWLRGRPRRWQFGLRSTPLWRTAGLALLVTVLVLGFEVGFTELAGVDEGDTDPLGTGEGTTAAIAFSLAAIVVAPVAEELFFRAFLYRALRNRLRVWSACAINAAIFSIVHVQYLFEPKIFVIIGAFAVGACLLYEATGSVFAPIAMHAIFNTLATVGTDAGYVVPLVVGTAVVIACIAVPARLGRAPSPFPPPARA